MSSASDSRASRRAAILGCVLALLLLPLAQAQDGSSTRPSSGMGRMPSKAQIGPEPGTGGPPPAAQNPYANDRAAAHEGRQLFVAMNCAGCHGGHGGGAMGPSLRDKVWLYGSEDGQIFDSIAQGRSLGMPAWGTQLPEDMIWKIVAYIKTLRTPEEVDPPR